jgi:ATP-binding cassette subfamily B protein
MTTLMAGDRILIMDDGQIVDQGTHDELIQRENLYRQIWDMQNQAVPDLPEGGG